LTQHDINTITNNSSQSQLIGRGGFGLVYRGDWQGREVAVKKQTGGSEAIRQIREELTYLMSLRGPHILPLLAACTETSSFALVTPFMPNGSLFDHLGELGAEPENPAGVSLPLRRRLIIFAEVVSALNFCHQRNVFHRDIKVGCYRT